MEPLRLRAGNRWFEINELKGEINTNGFSLQDINAIRFCQQWLKGISEFQFQTSGSTGTPKNIIFTREQLEASARLTEIALGLRRGYTALICLDVQFIAGAMMIVRSLVTGMNMILKDPSANPFEGLTEKVDFTALVPYQLATVLEQTPAQLSKVRSVIVGGAPLLKDVIHQLQELPSVCYATYGMTETITHVALQRLNGPGRQDYFQLLPGIHATTDARGCLVITATHLGPDPVVTNDVVSLLDEDKFRWIGRHDRVINSGGVKIQAEKIERVVEDFFSEWPVQRRFFVTGLPDQKLGEQVTLVVEGVELSQAAESRLKIRMKETLGSYELPKAIHYVPAFAETATQKVDRIETMRSVKK